MQQLRRQNIDVVNFGMGESDLGTPLHIRAAVQAAVERDEMSMTPPVGNPQLIDALRAWLAREYSFEFSDKEVLVSVGSKYVLYEIFLALLEPGDEVIIPLPAWPTVASLIESVGARPVLVPGDPSKGFRPDVTRIAAAVTDRTRALYLANPGNPTGAVLSAEELQPIVRLCAAHQLTVVSDGAYRAHTYEGAVPNLPQLAAAAGAPCVIVETLSKRYSMSGWRMGFAAGHADLIASMAAIQMQTLSSPPSVTQVACLAALSGPQDCVSASIEEFRRRRALIVPALEAIPRLRLSTRPNGAFFVLADVSAFLGTRTRDGTQINSDAELATHLLESAHVATAAGSWFGAPGHLRLSYTLSTTRIAQGCERLAQALSALS